MRYFYVVGVVLSTYQIEHKIAPSQIEGNNECAHTKNNNSLICCCCCCYFPAFGVRACAFNRTHTCASAIRKSHRIDSQYWNPLIVYCITFRGSFIMKTRCFQSNIGHTEIVMIFMNVGAKFRFILFLLSHIGELFFFRKI